MPRIPALLCAAIALISLPAHAEISNCAALMDAMHVPAADGQIEDENGYCSEAQMAMFGANQLAISRAIPVTGPEELYGTWLGDDQLLQLQGIMVAGQEVLRIEPGPDNGTTLLTQYWMKSSLPGIYPWIEGQGYDGIVARVVLEGSNYRYSASFSDPVQYGTRRLEWPRSDELFMLQRGFVA